MEKELIRLLRANEIECRISTISEKGLSLLLYKDARVDQRILDETFGPFGWKRSHQCIDGNLYCTVEIYDKESGCWVSKQDVGTMGFAEKEKSQASDSFKRACFNWGIGRELYSAPFIWIPASRTTIQEKNNKLVCYDKFYVRSIEYNAEREIATLTIGNEKNQVVYEMKSGQQTTEKQQGTAKQQNVGDRRKMTEQQNVTEQQNISMEQRKLLNAELQRTGVGMEAVMDRYQINEPEQISQELYDKVMKALAKTKTAQAA